MTSPFPAGRTPSSRLWLGLLGVLFFSLLGTTSAVADTDYPLPTRDQGQVSSSMVHAGECTIFSGGGFSPLTPLTIADNGTVVGATRADANGHFSYRVCFGTDAKLGRHLLEATGTGANGASRVVYAYVTVAGAGRSGHGGGAAHGNTSSSESLSGFGGGAGRFGTEASGALPFTGADVRDLLLAGLALVSAGTLLVRKGYRDRAQRRSARSTAA